MLKIVTFRINLCNQQPIKSLYITLVNYSTCILIAALKEIKLYVPAPYGYMENVF